MDEVSVCEADSLEEGLFLVVLELCDLVNEDDHLAALLVGDAEVFGCVGVLGIVANSLLGLEHVDVGALGEFGCELSLQRLGEHLGADIHLVHRWDCILESSIPPLDHLFPWLLELKIVDDLDCGVLKITLDIQRNALLRKLSFGGLAGRFIIFAGGKLDVSLLDNRGETLGAAILLLARFVEV